MLSERQLDELLSTYQKRMQAVSDEYLKQVGEHTRDIGHMPPSDVNRLTELRRLKTNMRGLKRRIAEESGLMASEVEDAFRKAAEISPEFARQYFGAGTAQWLKGAAKRSTYIERIIKAQLAVTQQAFKNLSQTTIVSAAYRNAVDVAVQTVQGGVESYTTAIRRVLRQTAGTGLQVQYPSGYKRRLDTAVRQNVLDGVRSINHNVMRQVGNEFGADGVEISAHALCAPDHIDFQGQQMSYKRFDALQATIRRPFGQWNCKHTFSPIILGVSQPAYSQAELNEYRENSEANITIDGVTKTRYEWTQEQRKTETAIRWQKDTRRIAASAGDSALVRESKQKESALKERYDRISEKAGVVERKDRMYVDTRMTSGNNLTNPTRSAIVNMVNGYDRRREERNTGDFSGLEEPMTKRHLLKTIRQTGVYDKRIKYEIDANPEIIGAGWFGHTSDDGRRMTFYPDAFKNREALVVTIGHEHRHVEQVRERGVAVDSVELSWREKDASSIEREFWEAYKKRVNYRERK